MRVGPIIIARRYTYCTAEWANAMAGDPLNRDGRLILFKVAACQPRGMLRALSYWNLMPLIGKADTLRDVVLAAIEPGRHKDAASLAAPYRQPGEAVLHDRIREVPSFTGRREALDKLGAALWRADGGAVAITQGAAVHGGGGIGKTALAQHYGWAERERYAGVWWLQADSATDIEDGLIALGAEFIPGLAEVRDRAEAVRTALGFIEGAGFEKPWLLIYDNVETPDVLKGRTPRNGAQTLVTSRFPDWKGRAEPLALDVFEPDEAVAFLLDRTGRDDRPGAARLAEALGWLALALDHAAAFCIESGDSFDDYRQLLAGWIKKKELPANTDYPQTVRATFTLAIEKAAAKCPAAETLMAILAFMAPDAIPRDIVTEDVLDAMALREATGALKNVSLVKVEPQAEGGPLLSIHRLVQMVMRGRLAEAGEAEAFAAKALKLVADAFPSGEGANDPSDVRSWPACARLYPHAMAVLDPIMTPVKPGHDAGEAHDTAASATLLLSQTGTFLYARANYAEAEPLMRRALAIDEARHGTGHPNVARDLNNLAALLQATNRLAEAEPLMHRALAIDEARHGAGHPDVARDLNNLAQLLQATNRLAEAEPLMRRALAIDEARHGAGHPDVARDLNNLAQLLQATNRLAEAEPLMRRALAIMEASLPDHHPWVQGARENLAALLAAMGKT